MSVETNNTRVVSRQPISKTTVTQPQKKKCKALFAFNPTNINTQIPMKGIFT